MSQRCRRLKHIAEIAKTVEKDTMVMRQLVQEIVILEGMVLNSSHWVTFILICDNHIVLKHVSTRPGAAFIIVLSSSLKNLSNWVIRSPISRDIIGWWTNYFFFTIRHNYLIPILWGSMLGRSQVTIWMHLVPPWTRPGAPHQMVPKTDICRSDELLVVLRPCRLVACVIPPYTTILTVLEHEWTLIWAKAVDFVAHKVPPKR